MYHWFILDMITVKMWVIMKQRYHLGICSAYRLLHGCSSSLLVGLPSDAGFTMKTFVGALCRRRFLQTEFRWLHRELPKCWHSKEALTFQM